MQFSPGGSDRFAITVATGIQHRLSQNEFTYSQRDLSEVRVVPNSQEMFMQFEMAPEVQQSAQPPKTNFFTTVGLKIKFGSPKAMSAPGQDYNATRSNKPGSVADGVGHRDEDTDADGLDDGTELVNDGTGSGDCDDSDSDRCIKPGERSSNDADSDADGVDDAIETAKDHRSTKALKKGDRLSTEISDGDADSDGDGIDDAIETAQDYNASRSNKPRSEISDDIWDDCDDDGSCPHPDELLHKAKELELTSAGNDIQNIKEVLDRCGEEVCEQVRLNADKRHEGVRRAMENPSAIDSEIEKIRSIVREDVESLGKCETDVCREVLAMEEQLLMKMNRLSDIAMVEPAQDYNATRSNKPTSRADDIGDGDADSDDDGIVDAIETTQNYNATRSNKPTSRADLDSDPDSDDDGVAKAISMARLIHPPNVIIAAGAVVMVGNPAFQANSSQGEMPMDEGQANDGDSDNNDNEDPLPSQRYDIQPGSYCVELSTMKISTNSQKAMRGSSDGNKAASATDYNSSRSNKAPSIADIGGDLDGDGFPDFMEDASLSVTKRKRPGRAKYGDITLKKSMDNGGDLDGDGLGDAAGLHFDLEIEELQSEASRLISAINSQEPSARADTNSNAEPGMQLAPSQTKVIVLGVNDDGDIFPLDESRLREIELSQDLDSDDDGLMDAIESATYSISKRSARTGPSTKSTGQENPLAKESEWQETPELEVSAPDNVYKWTYRLNALSGGEDLPGNGTLNVVFTDGVWHFDLQVDPVDPLDLDDDDDALPGLLQNSSFSISKRSARTGRN